MDPETLLGRLPYSEPFLFVDRLERIDEMGTKGSYTFPADAFFYQGHFKGNPITPGVILTECMAQIGVVCLGIYLLRKEQAKDFRMGLTGSAVEFFLPVLPSEKVVVESEKMFFRFQKLKCKVRMFNEAGKLVARGEIAGMVRKNE